MRDSGLPDVATGTYVVYVVPETTPADAVAQAAAKSLANAVVQRVLVDDTPRELPGPGGGADLRVQDVPLLGLDVEALARLSRDGGLALDPTEMQAVQAHFAVLGREPRRIELETIAQTWSEHCKHKTLTGRIRYEGEVVDNLLRQTIAHVTHTLQRDFCLSVFEDNAGVIVFDDEDAVCIKVETHNHPSAIEPFGGAGTGVGGVIRDVLGTGLAARPICSTDVFCVGSPTMPSEAVPKGCLPPLQVLRGVVAGVRDYGNPMGIPTVNGAVHFDDDFVGNPLVYVGTVGILPRDRIGKRARPGDAIVAVGGRTGRDGIHGATFSSLELHTDSESTSSGAVQIGDPITERRVMDAVLRARRGVVHRHHRLRRRRLSSAIGEVAEAPGVVHLDARRCNTTAPAESGSAKRRRMVLAVPPNNLARLLLQICAEEDVEAVTLGEFNPAPGEGCRCSTTVSSTATSICTSCARVCPCASARPDGGRPTCTTPTCRSLATWVRCCCSSWPTPTSPARSGSSASTTTRSKPPALANRCAECARTAPPTRQCWRPSSAHDAAWCWLAG
ncbi:MAG: AIR synthase related protein [Planctomycetota bacterium]